mmetsp:Transcript_12870/g.17550  ORF Transcript_12870/g.17550 Transcript_12870/m.17550 type:complete len:87 (-) Transcript_12870:79-339(-)
MIIGPFGTSLNNYIKQLLQTPFARPRMTYSQDFLRVPYVLSDFSTVRNLDLTLTSIHSDQQSQIVHTPTVFCKINDTQPSLTLQIH